MPVSLKDIAQMSGTSIGCVSRVLNGDKTLKVAPTTRKRIFDCCHQLGYVPKRKARRRSVSVKKVQIVFPRHGQAILEAYPNTFSDNDLGRFMRIMSEEVSQQVGNVDISVNMLEPDSPNERTFSEVDGVILYGDSVTQELIERVNTFVPVVTLDYDHTNDKIPAVVTPNKEAACNAVKLLIAMGHRKIGCIYEDVTNPASRNRYLGFEQAMAEAGLGVNGQWTHCTPFSDDKIQATVKVVLGGSERPTAVFCCHDWAALYVVKMAREMGISVPDDLSVVGFSNCEDVPLFQSRLTGFAPFLTSVEVYFNQMTRAAAGFLSDIITDRQILSYRYVMPASLMIRSSCRPPRA